MCDETGFAWPTALLAGGLEEAALDDGLASAARAHYRSGSVATIEPSENVRSRLKNDEVLFAIRTIASIDPGPPARLPLSGQLAITTERMMLVDGSAVTLAYFDEIEDVTLTADRLLVMLTNGTGFAVRSCHPRLLRVQLAEARARRIDRHPVASSKSVAAVPTDLARR
jgi:hypothetical protein